MNFVKETINIVKNYENLKISMVNLNNRYREITESLNSTKAINISDMPKGSGAGQPDDAICNLIYEKQIVVNSLKQTRYMIKKINNYLKDINETEKEIILKSYTSDITDTQLAESLSISRRTLIDKRNKAIRKLAIQIWGIEAV